MQLALEIRYYTEEYPWLCFRHAVEEANKGQSVKTEIDDFSRDSYLGPTECPLCYFSLKEKV